MSTIKNQKRKVHKSIDIMNYYHSGISSNNSYYSRAGFDGGLSYFTSDRKISLLDNGQRIDGKELKGYGLEIEAQCWSINDSNVLTTILKQFVYKLFPYGLFKIERDSSIVSNCESSCESVSQVMTKEFIRNHYADFRAMFILFNQLDISYSRTGNCGMHINISNALFGNNKKTQLENVKKLYYLINKHYAIFCELYQRICINYCGKMEENITVDKAKNMTRYFQNDRSFNPHRYCINFTHFEDGRIELRLPSGQDNGEDFVDTMELTFHLVKAVNSLSWNDLDNLEEVFKGCNLNVVRRLKRCFDSQFINSIISTNNGMMY